MPSPARRRGPLREAQNGGDRQQGAEALPGAREFGAARERQSIFAARPASAAAGRYIGLASRHDEFLSLETPQQRIHGATGQASGMHDPGAIAVTGGEGF